MRILSLRLKNLNSLDKMIRNQATIIQYQREMLALNRKNARKQAR